MRGMIPAQAPYEGGGAHDAQGLLLRRVTSFSQYVNEPSCTGTLFVKEHDIKKEGYLEHAVNNGEDEAIHLRLDDVDFHVDQAL